MTEVKKAAAPSRVGQRMKPRGPQHVEAEPVSTDEGQEDTPAEATLGMLEVQQTPPKQEPEAEQVEADPALAELRANLKASEDVKVEDLQPEVKPDEAAVAFVRRGDTGEYHVGVDLPPGGGLVELHAIGPQPNGDFAVVIAIPEHYVGSVKDFAEANGRQPLEDWCTEFFTQHLEAYCTPLKGR